MSETREIRIKRLIHRSNYRGFKEADLILGGFSKLNAGALSDTELDALEALLDEKDHDIYDWISGSQPVPARHDTALFKQICAFKPKI